MCRRFRLLYHIETVTAEEILQYLARLFRIYCIFFCISLINLGLAYNQETVKLILAIVGTVLYAINIGMIKYVVDHPMPHVAIFPIISNIILCGFNIGNLVYTIVITKSLWGLFSVISILLQFTTIYILYKLRSKIINQEHARLAGELNVFAENPSAPIKNDYA